MQWSMEAERNWDTSLTMSQCSGVSNHLADRMVKGKCGSERSASCLRRGTRLPEFGDSAEEVDQCNDHKTLQGGSMRGEKG